MKLSTILAVISAAFLLGGCLVPNNYEARVFINNDGTYKYTYDGEGTHVAALQMIRNAEEAGRDDDVAKIESDLDEMAAKATKEDPTIKYARHLGRGVFAFESSGEGRLPTVNHVKRHIPQGGFLSVTPSVDRLIVKTDKMSERDIEEFAKLGVESRGTICIETDMAVLEHNADSEPGFFRSGYCWDLDMTAGEAVKMILTKP